MSLFAFFRSVGRLKQLPRQGWVDRGVPAPESVAEHIYRAAIMAWVLGSLAGLETHRLVKLVLVHDLPEAEVGDATPYEAALAAGVGLEEALATWREMLTAAQRLEARDARQRLEAEGLARLAAHLPEAAAAEVVDLWRDYAARGSPEAQFAAEVDKLEALLQAIEYAAAGHQSDVGNFLEAAREEVRHPVLVAFLRELEAAAHALPEPG